MDNVLDLSIRAAQMRLGLVERALHDRGRWEAEYAGVRVPVSRFIREDRVSLVAHFPPLCPLGEPLLAVGIHIDGELVRMLPIEQPLDEDGCEFWVDLVLAAPVTV